MIWNDDDLDVLGHVDKLLARGCKAVFLLGEFDPCYPDDISMSTVFRLTEYACEARAWSGYGKIVSVATQTGR